MEQFLNYFDYPNKIMYKVILKTINSDFKCKCGYIHSNPISLFLYLNNNKSKIDNIFLSNEHKQFLHNYLLFVSKKLFLLTNIIYKWKNFIKNKHITNYANNKDLYLEDIDNDQCIKVYQYHKTYLLTLCIQSID